MECTRDNVNLMSNYCLFNSFPEGSECFPLQNSTKLFSQIVAGWSIFISSFGFFGNLLTLIAIPLAAKNSKFGLNLNIPTTIFTLNLAFADFSYCAINLPLYALQYFMAGRWPGNDFSCQAVAAFRHTSAFAAWMSVAMIAVSRCATITRYGVKQLSGRSGLIFVLLVWIYPNIILLPIYFQWIGEFGYNCLSGVCEIIPLANSPYHPTSRAILYGTAFIIPGALTLASYLIIACYIFFNPHLNVLKTAGTNDLRRMLYKRDRQLAKALLAVCSCYFLFVMPITILDVFPQEPEEDQEAIAEAYLAVYCLYWLQYSANFVIYAARCEQYQKAYKYLFEHVKMCICGASQWKATGAIMVINHQPKDEAIFEPNESSTIIIISRLDMAKSCKHSKGCCKITSGNVLNIGAVSENAVTRVKSLSGNHASRTLSSRRNSF